MKPDIFKRITKFFHAPSEPRPRRYAPQESGFFKLPPELRTTIYHLVLIEPLRPLTSASQPDVPATTGPPPFDRKLPPYWLAIVRTCRQAYDEAIPLVYQSHEFWLGDNEPKQQLRRVRQFLKTIPSANAVHLTTVWLNFPELYFDFRIQKDQLLRPEAKGEVKVAPASITSLRILREGCPNIRSLLFLVYGGDNLHICTALRANGLTYLVPFEQALDEIDAELKRFTSLSLVLVYWPLDMIWEAAPKMMRLGWMVRDPERICDEALVAKKLKEMGTPGQCIYNPIVLAMKRWTGGF
jgi:hypothetical protein